ncbi:hypothetical protein [Kribbella ginsengisoli]|uniref:hypothetical protein n=1 Tax=Kribbella ginsengisoli TaxID=363865 RepID=UPI0031DB6A3C
MLIRPATADDRGFLEQMLLEAYNWDGQPRFTLEQLSGEDHAWRLRSHRRRRRSGRRRLGTPTNRSPPRRGTAARPTARPSMGGRCGWSSARRGCLACV